MNTLIGILISIALFVCFMIVWILGVGDIDDDDDSQG